jgi:hypothetical protein
MGKRAQLLVTVPLPESIDEGERHVADALLGTCDGRLLLLEGGSSARTLARSGGRLAHVGGSCTDVEWIAVEGLGSKGTLELSLVAQHGGLFRLHRLGSSRVVFQHPLDRPMPPADALDVVSIDDGARPEKLLAWQSASGFSLTQSGRPLASDWLGFCLAPAARMRELKTSPQLLTALLSLSEGCYGARRSRPSALV